MITQSRSMTRNRSVAKKRREDENTWSSIREAVTTRIITANDIKSFNIMLRNKII